MIYKKVCPICGKEFKTIYPNKKSCSKNCLRKYKNEYHKAWRAGKTEMYQCMMVSPVPLQMESVFLIEVRND